MKNTIAIAVLMSAVTVSAFAADKLLPKDGGPGIVDYHYGQNLDVAKLNSLKKSNEKDGVACVVMVYEDHKGVTHQVRFLEETYNANSNG